MPRVEAACIDIGCAGGKHFQPFLIVRRIGKYENGGRPGHVPGYSQRLFPGSGIADYNGGWIVF